MGWNSPRLVADNGPVRPRTFLRRPAIALAGLLVATAAGWRPVQLHLQAASLLLRFGAPGDRGRLASFGRHEVETASALLPGGTPARRYVPRGVEKPPAMVLVHGVHHLGIEEPRLKRFAEAIAGTGIEVLTPEVKELAGYRIVGSAIDTIGTAAHALRERAGRPVGVMGLSFAGGLALLAAADPRFAGDVSFVTAVGAHDDLPRVLRFFATDQIERPDGSIETLKAHDYGALVFVAAHPESFFDAAEAPLARDALVRWLEDDAAGARATAARLGPSSRERVEGLFERRVAPMTRDLLAAVEALAPSMAAASPHGRLGAIQVPCFLLHGAGDNVIPATETLWLARDLPPGAARAVLVSPAIVHVELGKVSSRDRWDLVHFLAGVLDAAR